MSTRPALLPVDTAAPFIDGYLAYLLARASHLISAEFHAVVRRSRLPVLQWRVLATLADGQRLSVGEVASQVGYEDIFYFSRLFKKRMGVGPSAFRQKLKG